MERDRVHRYALLLGVYISVAVMLTATLVPDSVPLEVGQASIGFVGAPRRVEDRHTTEALRKSARDAVGEVYDQDNTIVTLVLNNVSDVLGRLATIAAADMPDALRLQAVREQLPFPLPDSIIKIGWNVDAASHQALRSELAAVLEPLYQLGIKEDGMDLARTRLRDALRETMLASDARSLLVAIVPPLMTHNLRLNEVATERAREDAAKLVSPVFLQQGQKIIGQGEIATLREITLLSDLGLLRTGFDYRAIAGVLLLVLLLLAFPLSYLYFHYRAVYSSTLQLGLMSVICLGVAVVSFALSGFAGYLMPVAAASMLIAVLVDARVGVGVGMALSLLVAGFTGFEPRIFVVALLGSAAGVYAVSNSELRRSLVRSGIVVGVVNALTVAAFALLSGDVMQVAFRDIFLGLANGLLSAILTIGSLPFLESAFGVVSSIKLAELANPQQPLLKRLLIEAPGTYHHSLIVANLAESAALQVGADTLRTRVGAYYHDVGKVERPYFFIENQMVAENPHDDYSPHLSALIITSHVKDGVKLARQYKLPQVIIDIIREHHGTSVVQYFFNKAQKADHDAKEDDFSYEGPRPKSKEAAIVMLADVVEAAVRAMTAPTPLKIEQRVRSLLRDKLHAGQLDASELTLRDIDKIGSAFISHLTGIFHRRIEYPEQQGGIGLDGGFMEQRTRSAVTAQRH